MTTIPREAYEALRDAGNNFAGYACLFQNEGTQLGRERAEVAEGHAAACAAALANFECAPA